MLEQIINRLEAGERLNKAEFLWAFGQASLHELGLLADKARRRIHPDDVATYIIDRNINYTNVCTSRCRFCAFYRESEADDAYVLDKEQIFRKIEETLALGGSGVMMQGGLNPQLKLPFFEDLLRSVRLRYSIDLHCFSPPEILFISRISDVTVEECLRRLMEAGLDSLPGGGAEILADDVRRRISPHKCTAAEWLQVMETAHRLGLKTTATMMFGCGEALVHRMAHLELLRSLQDRTGGFVSFIPWTFQWPHTELGRDGWVEVTAMEYLRMVALSRLFLDNFFTVQASWVTQGLKVAQVALHYGANDLGSVMIEENVVAATGVTNRTNEQELRHAIADAGFTPARRNNIHQRLAVTGSDST
ncbi:MAG: dehypoxanthine futalosine cyclase [Acidobacteria bacterium]|nr:dehypoxanthine futalosine cyclase [Acidobacteriota bacterium]